MHWIQTEFFNVLNQTTSVTSLQQFHGGDGISHHETAVVVSGDAPRVTLHVIRTLHIVNS